MEAILNPMYEKYPELKSCDAAIHEAFFRMKQSFRDGGKLLVCGNGGSASDSEHIVGELMKGFMERRPVPQSFRDRLQKTGGEEAAGLADSLQGALPAISLVSHSALMTAFANDVAPDMVFAQQVYGYGRPGDVLLGLSTSGNSMNVVRAVQVARAAGLVTIGLTGRQGGRLKELCDVAICVPHDSTPDVQERHLPVYHALCLMLEQEFFAS